MLNFRPTIIFLVICINLIFFSYSCTFGSVGNSKEEELLVLQNLLRVSREIPSTLNFNLISYDTQSDDNLNSFVVISNQPAVNTSYTFAMKQNMSFLAFNRVEFRFNPNDKIAGIFSVKDGYNANIKTHTPFTVPLDLPAANPYGRTYTIIGSRINAYSNQNSNGIGLGSVNQQNLGKLTNAPQGVVASTVVYFDRLDLQATISRTNPISEDRQLVLSIRDVHITIPPRCRIPMIADTTTEFYLGFRYSSFFRDIISATSNISVLNSIFTGNPGDTITITDLDSRYGNFISNFQLADNIFIQDTCNL